MTEADAAAFWRDGVVCLRGVLPAEWLARMAEPFERELAGARSTDLSGMADEVERAGGATTRTGGPGAGRFRAGTDHWRADADFRAFATESPLPALVAALLRSPEIYLYEDSLLVKEPGTREATAFHQDLGYFHVAGEQVCTTWCPLDPVDEQSGALRYVRGSHAWGRVFRPNLFVTRQELPGTGGDTVPDVESDPDGHELVSFAMQPGDVAVHHARTVHGAHPNASARRRRAISVRYCGADARFLLRRGAPTKPHHEGLRDGDALGGAGCPRVLPVQAAGSTRGR